MGQCDSLVTSTNLMHLPGSFLHPGNLAQVCQFTQTKTADAEFAIIRPGATAQLTAVVLPNLKLGFSLLFGN